MAGKNFIADIRALIEGDAADLPPRDESRRQLDKWRLTTTMSTIIPSRPTGAWGGPSNGARRPLISAALV